MVAPDMESANCLSRPVSWAPALAMAVGSVHIQSAPAPPSPTADELERAMDYNSEDCADSIIGGGK